ncbi:MAG: hypothetical protein ACI4Q5_02295 [Porcipelethomonas sp.]
MKKNIILSLVLSIFIVLSGCGNSNKIGTVKTYDEIENTIEPQVEETTEATSISIEEYRSKISDFNNSIYDASILLSNISQYERNYWENLEELGRSVDSNKVYENAMDWLKENASEDYDITDTVLQDNYKSICTSYSEIVGMGINTPDVSAINNAYEELFSNYCMLYTLATNPDGDINTFVDKFNEYIDNIKNYNTMLSTFLEE